MSYSAIYIRMMEDNYVLFDIIADGNFVFQKRRSVGTQFQSVTVKDQSTQTNDLKLILPEKSYSTHESLNSTLMSI